MEGQSGLSELSVTSWVSAFEGCPLGGVPLYDSPGWSFSDAQVTCRQRGYPTQCELASICAQCGYMLLNWYPFIYMGAYKL